MWIVKLALTRPYTFIVLALVIVLLGVFTILRTPTDIFPNIDIPIVSAIWNSVGLPPEEMSSRIVGVTERLAPTAVNDLEHTESQSLTGQGVIKFFFQPNVREPMSFAQITGFSQTLLRQVPLGTQPPFILAYNASTVPILQLAVQSPSLSESQLFDFANNAVRPGLANVRGASMPFPYGGKQRQVQVDLDPDALRATGLSAGDVSAAIGNQNLIIPSGTEKIGNIEYDIKLNSSPLAVADLNNVPIRYANGKLVYVRDVANVRDGSSPQTNLVRVNGRHSVLMSVLKTGSASTLEIIEQIKRQLPVLQARLPPDLKITTTGDQSLFVRAAVDGVVREGVIAAALDRPGDPAVPRLLAQHADHHDLDSAVGAGLDHLPVGDRRDDQHHDPRAVWRWRSASWSTTRRSRSRTSTGISSRARRSRRRSSTARTRSRCRRWFRRCASASCSSRCSC